MELKKTTLTRTIALVFLFFILKDLYYSRIIDRIESIGIIAALIIIIFVKSNYLIFSIDQLTGSLKKAKNLIVNIIIDLLMFLSVYFLTTKSFSAFMNLTQNRLGDIKTVTSNPELINLFIKDSVLLALAFFALTFFICVLLKAIVWRFLARNNFSTKYFLKFFAISFFWLLLWIIPFSAAFFSSVKELKFIGIAYLLFVYTHFTSALYYSISTDRKKLLKTTGLISIGLIAYLITPYALIYSIYTALSWIAKLILPANEFIQYALLVLIISISRNYLFGLYELLTKKNK